MAVASNIIKVIKEGQAQLHVPKTVFYNPVQEFNRDLSVLVLRTYLKHNLWHHKKEAKYITDRGGMKVLDALSASGLRSIRYAKELGSVQSLIKSITANDISDAAVELIRNNIKLNNVEDKIHCTQNDAIHLLHSSSRDFKDRFHVIDLDPFGTGAQFFDAALSSIGEAGLLMVTCTDAAVLCGNASESCFARYGSMSLKGEFCHDQAIRIVLRSLERHASVYGRYIKPLLSISADFYIRVFVQVFTQQAETKRSASKLSQVYLCKECKTYELNPLGHYDIKENSQQAASKNLAVKYKFKPPDFVVGDKCSICGGRYTIGGPIWSDPIHDNNFLNLMKQELDLENVDQEFGTYRRIKGLLYVCVEELAVPLLHSLTHMSSAVKIRVPKSRDIMSALVNAGYKVSPTHTNPNGLKTDAPNNVVWDIFCQIANDSAEKDDKDRIEVSNTDLKSRSDINLMLRLRNRKPKTTYDLSYNPAIELPSQRLSLLRFQLNPAKEWGPMPRPVSSADAKIKADNQYNQHKSKLDPNKQFESSGCQVEETGDSGCKKRKLIEENVSKVND